MPRRKTNSTAISVYKHLKTMLIRNGIPEPHAGALLDGVISSETDYIVKDRLNESVADHPRTLAFLWQTLKAAAFAADYLKADKHLVDDIPAIADLPPSHRKPRR